jgi:hypothetical protein
VRENKLKDPRFAPRPGKTLKNDKKNKIAQIRPIFMSDPKKSTQNGPKLNNSVGPIHFIFRLGILCHLCRLFCGCRKPSENVIKLFTLVIYEWQ